MNKDLLLTDEEIIAYATKDKEYCDLSVEVGIWVAQAQLDKLSKWVDKPDSE